MSVPGPRRGMITQIEGDERDPRLDQSSGQESLLTPEVLAISVANRAGSLDRSNVCWAFGPVNMSTAAWA